MSLATELRDKLIAVIAAADDVSVEMKGLPPALLATIVQLKASVVALRNLALQSQMVTVAMLAPTPFGPDDDGAPEELHVQCVTARVRSAHGHLNESGPRPLSGKDLAAGERPEPGWQEVGA